MDTSDIHANALVLTAHNDIYEINQRINEGEEYPLREVILPRLHEAGVDVLFLAIGGDSWLHSNYTDLRLKGALANWARIERQIDACGDGILRLISSDQVPELPDGKLRIAYSLEGGLPLRGSVELLEVFYCLGVRVLQPVWNLRNDLGDGALESGYGKGGLSIFGREVIGRMDDLGMIIDLAHMNERGIFDAVRITSNPVICSHANSKAICAHPLNASDAVIDAIADTGGCIGVHSGPSRVHEENPTLEMLVNHIQYLVERVGIDHIGLGLNEIEFTGLFPPQDERFAWEQDSTMVTKGFESIRDLPKMIELLLNRGFSEVDVRKILAGNFLRVFKQVVN